MNILANISLKPYNTFGIDALASHFVEISSVDNLRQVLQLEDYHNKLVLSGGSNMLISQNIDALVLYINMKGIKVLWEDDSQVVIKVMAGENWHQLVQWTLDHNYGGLENLSLIPGNTGTAPIQNIGAYGVELKDVFESCEAMHRGTQLIKQFSKEECRFNYRDSYFKKEGKSTYIITSVNLKLTKKDHALNTSYGAIEEELKILGVEDNPTIQQISKAVISIRQKKLPDPKVLGNSGSFFKNPVVNEIQFNTFIKKHPKAPYYEMGQATYKIPAGWLIEQCGYKGFRRGDAGVHKNQALVLVNYGKATGAEILHLAKEIQGVVHKKFGVQIQPEVNIIN